LSHNTSGVTPALHYLTLFDPFEPARPRHLAYYEWGDAANRHVAVCAHGLSRNGRDFDYLAKVLSPHFRVLCPDMAGRGKSDWLVNKADYSYSLYMSDCLALLHQLKLERVTWIGTSIGGIIGMMIAAEQKQHISALALNDIGAVVSAEGLRRILGYVGIGNAFFESRDAAMSYLKSVLAPFHITSEEHWRHMFEVSLTPLPGGRYALAYDPGINQPFRDAVSKTDGIADVDLTPFWKAVTCPVLLLRGERSDILPRAVAQAMCDRPQPVKLVEIMDTGHAPALLQESQIRIVADWALQRACPVP
jgi:pimeloyl-ACP methyl ester carboxylesterase